MTFDPEATLTDDSSIFGFPQNTTGKLCILPTPWEVTASFRKGTINGPKAILDASKQMDLFHPYWKNTYEAGIEWDEDLFGKILDLNNKASEASNKIISNLENSIEPTGSDLQIVNKFSEQFNDLVYTWSKKTMNLGKKPALVGGDHSCPFGLIKALSEKHSDFSIVHFDAHFDLRKAYQGFKHSHASIMYNVISEIKNPPGLYQIGLRDFSETEYRLAYDKTKFLLDYDFQFNKIKGALLEQQLDKLFVGLSESIYISFDIDGLAPYFCSSTGTPVPGGLSYNEAVFIFNYLHGKGHKLIGFDLVEVAPASTEKLNLDEINASRLLYELSCFALKT